MTITSLPPREPVVTPYRVPTCRCVKCGAARRGEHPDLRADQTGASAHRYGDDVLAAATILHYGVGVPLRRVPRVMQMLTGVAPTQSAIMQHALKQADPGGAVDVAYQQLRAQIARAPIVHTDDTSWRVTHEREATPDRKAYVMGFESAGEPRTPLTPSANGWRLIRAALTRWSACSRSARSIATMECAS